MLYEILKYAHILVAIAWLGGAFGMILLGSLAARKRDTATVVTVAAFTEKLATLVFMPASLIMLVLGIAMVWQAWSFTEAWIVIGILGVVATGAIGILALTPQVKKLAAVPQAEKAAVGDKLLSAARADQIMLAVIVWDMVSKPAWGDVIEILAMAIVVALGVYLFIRK